MFSTSKWMLIAGCVLLALPQLAGAQTLDGARNLMKEGELTQALDEAERYIAAKPKDAQGLFVKGLILTGMGRAQDAIATFTRLTEKFPELPEPYNNLAVLHAAQKQYDKAQVALEMAIRADPGYAVAYENLGDLYVRRASEFYAKALQLGVSGNTARAKLDSANALIKLPAPPGAAPNPPPQLPQPSEPPKENP